MLVFAAMTWLLSPAPVYMAPIQHQAELPAVPTQDSEIGRWRYPSDSDPRLLILVEQDQAYMMRIFFTNQKVVTETLTREAQRKRTIYRNEDGLVYIVTRSNTLEIYDRGVLTTV